MLVIIGIIAVICLIIFIQYNTLIKLKMKVKQSRSGIDIYCQQRFELIPNLVETVKGYMNYEKETLENIIKLRTQYINTKDIKTGQELNNKLNKIMAVVEKYPDLKASEQFLNLQKNLEKMESQLQAARRIYNIDVTNYNTKIQTIPYNILANILGFYEEDLFELEDINDRNNINVQL